MASQVATSAFVTPSQMDRLMKLIGERRDVSFVVLPPPAEETAPVTDAQVASWYEATKAGYCAPEPVSIEYVNAHSTDQPEPAVAEYAELRQRDNQEKARFIAPEHHPDSPHMTPVHQREV